MIALDMPNIGAVMQTVVGVTQSVFTNWLYTFSHQQQD